MKKLLIYWLFCMIPVFIFGQDVCWYNVNGKVCYEISTTRFLLKSEMLDANDIKSALQHTESGSLKNVYDLEFGWFVVEMQNTNKADMLELRKQWNAREDVKYASSVFGDNIRPEGATSYTNEVIVTLKSKDDLIILQKIADDYQMTYVKFDALMYANTYLLTLSHHAKKDAVQTALELNEAGLFENVQPAFIYLCPLEDCFLSSSNNINIITKQEIIIYPNPVSDILYVDLDKFVRSHNKTTPYDIRLYNSVGLECLRTIATGEILELNVSSLSDGIYFLNIYNKSNSKSETHKIIIKQ
jgi:hypothetical protein